jgi:ABC-type Na+ efflux pump permease subunit
LKIVANYRAYKEIVAPISPLDKHETSAAQKKQSDKTSLNNNGRRQVRVKQNASPKRARWQRSMSQIEACDEEGRTEPFEEKK